jgi:hypothetical protein
MNTMRTPAFAALPPPLRSFGGTRRRGKQNLLVHPPQWLCYGGRAIAFLGAMALITVVARAGTVGHYNGGVMDIRDYSVPDPGFYGVVYNYYYTSDRLNDGNGNQINSVTIKPGPGPGVTLPVSVNVDIYALSPVVMWVAPWEFHDVKYAAYIAPSFVSGNSSASISTIIGSGRNPSFSQFGVGDLLVQPVWFGLTLTNWDFALGYGFYAPVGTYNTSTITLPIVGPVKYASPDNTGLGFWTQQFQGSAYWYPWSDRRMAVMTALTYEINSQNKDFDITPGQTVTLNWGISEYLPLTKNQNLLLEVGPLGYDSWQVTHDTGSDASNASVLDQVHAAGCQVGLSYVPWNAALDFLFFKEYSSVGRLQGKSFSINLLFKF